MKKVFNKKHDFPDIEPGTHKRKTQFISPE